VGDDSLSRPGVEVHPKTWTKYKRKAQKRYTIEEKKHAVQLVKDGLSRAEAARQTGICKDLIRDTMKLIDLHGWEILEQRRIYSAEEKFTILQDMQENQLTLAEASIKHGIKKSH
jgi:transposase-like protein